MPQEAPQPYRNDEPVPACPKCGSTDTAAVTRAERAIYCRCNACGHVWGVRTPAVIPEADQ